MYVGCRGIGHADGVSATQMVFSPLPSGPRRLYVVMVRFGSNGLNSMVPLRLFVVAVMVRFGSNGLNGMVPLRLFVMAVI